MKTRYLKVANVRTTLLISNGNIPTIGISWKAQNRENKRPLRRLPKIL